MGKSVLLHIIWSSLFSSSNNNKRSLTGIPNAYFDCMGRPFGLVLELSLIGWPKPPEGSEELQLDNIAYKCTPREGGEGSWIYAHHCCASWSAGVQFDEQVGNCLFVCRSPLTNVFLYGDFRLC